MKRLTTTVLSALPLLLLAACGDDNKTTGTTDVAADTAPDTAGGDSATDTSGGDSAEDATADTAPDTAADSAEDTTAADTAADSSADTTPGDTTPGVCTPTEPPCSDEQIAQLELSDSASGGPIAEEGTEPGVFVSHIDATAGGFNGSLGYTYAKFTDTGLVAVDLSDEDALDSTAWDIAARRFILRLNSGVSGPSCVTGGRTVPGTKFDLLSALPQGVTLREEQYFNAGGDCEYVPDTSGIGSPQTVLSSFWSYTGCVTMTGNVYVLALADGRHVKLQVMSYYTPAVQDTCDETDAVPTPNGGGNVVIKWAFIE